MRAAFCLFKYFPYGGLQRDFARIAEICLARGHELEVFTTSWEGPVPEGLNVHLLPARGWTNHGQMKRFAARVGQAVSAGDHDVVVGFNKMPGLDLYYAADTCYRARLTAGGNALRRLTSRCRTYLALERGVFDRAAATRILLISPAERDNFVNGYGTPEERFVLLPPGIAPDRFRPDDACTIRSELRRELDIPKEALLLLMVGSAFRTKGVDRTIEAMASLPGALRDRAVLVVVGEGRSGPLVAQAGRHELAGRVRFVGGRSDVPRFLFSADLLVHPARTENTGTVLVEALAAGLAVLTTANCGYAFHVRDAGAGLILPDPFSQDSLNDALASLLDGDDLAALGRAGLCYAAANDLVSLHEKVADAIEAVAGEKLKC